MVTKIMAILTTIKELFSAVKWISRYIEQYKNKRDEKILSERKKERAKGVKDLNDANNIDDAESAFNDLVK